MFANLKPNFSVSIINLFYSWQSPIDTQDLVFEKQLITILHLSTGGEMHCVVLTCLLYVTAMHSFVLHCPELVTEDVTRRLLPPLECALTMMAQ